MSDLKEGGLFVDEKPEPARPVGMPAKKDVKKRWIMVAVGGCAFALVVSSLLSDDPVPVTKREEAAPLINLTPENVDERSWQVRSQAEIQTIRDEAAQLRSEVQSLRNKLTKLQAQQEAQQQEALSKPEPQLPAGVVPPPQMGGNLPITQDLVPPPPVPPTSGGVLPLEPPAVPPPFTSEYDRPAPEPMVFAPPAAANSGPRLSADIEYKENEHAGMLVAGAFAPVVLLNGIDAGTSSGSRSNPQPILMRIQDNAVLPGSGRYVLRSCFVLGSGYGELSAERVYMRLARLSCVDKDDRLVLSVPVQGYVVDSDNTLGMRGRVTDRQGARLGKALLAGFAEGLSSALGGAQGTLTTGVLGNTTSISGADAMRASGLAGASTAAGQLAEFYLKEAQSIFPVITVEGGRLATIVFTEAVNLAWGNVDAQFVRQVEPRN